MYHVLQTIFLMSNRVLHPTCKARYFSYCHSVLGLACVIKTFKNELKKPFCALNPVLLKYAISQIVYMNSDLSFSVNFTSLLSLHPNLSSTVLACFIHLLHLL